MDLASIKSQVIEKELYIEGVGATGFVLQLRYESSPEVQAVNKKFQNKIFEEAKKGKRGDRQKVTEQFTKDRIIAHIAGWRWKDGASYNGEQPEFSKAQAQAFIEAGDEFSYFLRTFIEDEIGDAESFLEQSASS